MKVVIPNQPTNKKQPTNREFSYGDDGCNTCMLVTFFPCYLGLIPTQAYNTLVFNNQEQRIEKYYNGYGIYCCCSKLEVVINYN